MDWPAVNVRLDTFRVLNYTLTGLMTLCTILNFYVFQQTVMQLHEIQKEIGLSTSSSQMPLFNQTTDLTSSDPVEPLTRSFWLTFFLVSPTVALVWYELLDFTVANVLQCMFYPQLRVLAVAKAKGYHLSPRYQVALSPFVISVAFDNFVFWWNVVQVLRTIRTMIRNEERRIRNPAQFSQTVDPVMANLSNFNQYQLQTLRRELVDLETAVHPANHGRLRSRVREIDCLLRQLRSTNTAARARAPSPSDECVICWTETPRVTFSPCGHTVVCQRCVTQWKEMAERNPGREVCPQCRMWVMTTTYMPTYERPLLSAAQYERQRDETTNRELQALYTHVRRTRASQRTLQHCPSQAFESEEAFHTVTGRRPRHMRPLLLQKQLKQPANNGNIATTECKRL
ncbi:hypothetical protein SARC_04351 [Sphaeroforma arctica JP610]|uniref:RING-type domain-containing protein n=1 Tax=Sphaeroforma arctica JP610 TaxID=667725 RepID=A0A0L0G2T0_9EUKA|nr:hypothetical protein SARC_04351 [Sphaeroforma arctica JP610]KNC83385.1 hypothetical protein SARC_04351 [Sphaeroforma arctica JP610]|eukprot:XP_014157287.1 hypothetical protein SARC_04351 [Sphaeroforma arctica JP610]